MRRSGFYRTLRVVVSTLLVFTLAPLGVTSAAIAVTSTDSPIERVSVATDGQQGNGRSEEPQLSADGRYSVFTSYASNLVVGDTNGNCDVFIHDGVTGQTSRVSVSSAGAEGDRSSYSPTVSSDGRFVAFVSAATNLVSDDTNGCSDVFVHDRTTGDTMRVSVASDGGQADSDSSNAYPPCISDDGRLVGFMSEAANLVSGDSNGRVDVFVHDCISGETSRVSVSTSGVQANGNCYPPAISSDGRFISFESEASNLVADDTNGIHDTFVHDRETGVTTRVSVASDGSQATGVTWTIVGYKTDVSADGRYVVFETDASNLVAGDTNNAYDIFRHDRETGVTERVSASQQEFTCTVVPSKGEAPLAVFATASPNDGSSDYVFDWGDGNVNVPGTYAKWHTYEAAGNYTITVTHPVFGTAYSKLVEVTNPWSGGGGEVSSFELQANASSYYPSVSDDGRYVSFGSFANNLVPTDTNSEYDMFVHDCLTSGTVRSSIAADGTQSNDDGYYVSISADGRHMAFESRATNLVPDDTNGVGDVFVRKVDFSGALEGTGDATDPYNVVGQNPDLDDAPAIVLISGLFSSTDDGTWDRVERELRDAGYNVRKAPTEDGATRFDTIDSTGSLSENAARLSAFLATSGNGELHDENREVILIGHSMGGIIARAFADNPELVEDSGTDVKAIVQIGSPNNGSPFATAASIIPFTESPATHDLSERNMDSAFNPAHMNTGGIPIYQLGGGFFPVYSADHIPSYWDDPVDWGLEHLAQGVNEAAFSHEVNDGLVSVSSLKGPNYLRGRVWAEPKIWNLRHSKGTYTKDTFGVFMDVGTIPPRTDVYDDNDALADSFMRALKGALYDAAANASQSSGVAAVSSDKLSLFAASEYEAIAAADESALFAEGGSKTLPAATLTLSESATARVSRSIEGTSALLTVEWGAGDIDINVSDGSGVVDCVTVGQETGSRTLLVHDVVLGDVDIDLGLTGVASTEATVTTIDSGPTALYIDAASESIASEPVAVTAYLGEDSSKLVDASATATLGEDSVTLVDDGVAPDATAGDGVLSGYVTAPAVEGLFNITVTASGTDSAGHTVEREAFSQIAISEPVASLTGSYLLRGVEATATLLGSVELDVGVQASEDASLSLGADFVSAGGVLLVQPKTSTHLSAGEEATVTLSVSAEALYASLPATDTVDVAVVSLRHLMPDSDAGLDSAQGVASFGPVGPFDLAVGALSFGVTGDSPTSDPKVGFSGTAICTTETVTGVEVSFDGGEEWYSALATDGEFDSGFEDYYVWAILPEGNWSVRARALGANGPLPGPESGAEAAVIVDSTAPTTTDDAPSGWQTQDTTVTLSAEDDLSGVAATYYTLDSGPETEYTAPLVLGHGVHTLTYWSVDAAGNTEEAHEVTVYVDTEPPTGTMSLCNGATYSDASITIDSDVNDAVQMRFVASRDGVNWGDGPGWADYTDSVEVGVSESGTWYYKVDYRDEAGNVLTLVDDVIVDADAPTTTSDALPSYSDTAVITLEATDPGGSGVSQTYYSLNGADPVPYTAPIRVSGFGAQVLEYWSVDAVGNTEDRNIDIFSVLAVTHHFIPIAGTNRYSTAIEASKHAYPDGATTVVIATGTNWPDALGGAALAGVVDGPLLLTATEALPDNVLVEVKRLGATKAYILGGTAAVSEAVESTLRANLAGGVTRLAGANRYFTADLVAAKVIALQGSEYDHDAFIATGENFPDALGASPLAASGGAPIILVKKDGTPHLPSSVDDATILGGAGAVSTVTESAVRSALGTSNVTRVGGTDRYDTAARIAEFGVGHGMHWDGVGIATGAQFPDAMSGGAMLGSFDSVMLLTDPSTLSSAASQRLSANKASIGTVHYIGGTGAVSEAVRDQVEQVLE